MSLFFFFIPSSALLPVRDARFHGNPDAGKGHYPGMAADEVCQFLMKYPGC
jgi:hypothetical protein